MPLGGVLAIRIRCNSVVLDAISLTGSLLRTTLDPTSVLGQFCAETSGRSFGSSAGTWKAVDGQMEVQEIVAPQSTSPPVNINKATNRQMRVCVFVIYMCVCVCAHMSTSVYVCMYINK